MTTYFPRSRGSQIYLALLVVVAVGLVLVIVGPWRTGLGIIGASFVTSSVARVLTPPEHVGMLRVRGKVFDVTWTMLLGVALLVLAIAVPPPPAM